MAKLFKLKFYCNYCKRQCVDENGFRVHCATFSHQAAVERFNRDPAKHKASASTDFLEGFCAVLRGFAARQKIKLGGQRGFDDEWVDANLVYQEYIRDRHHTHLSATRWKSVAGFVRFLGQKGLVEVKQKKPNSDSFEESEYLYIVPEQPDDCQSSSSEDEEEEHEEQSPAYEKDPTKRPKWFIKLIDKSPEAILAAKNKNLQQRQSNEEQNQQVKQLEAVQKQAQLATSKNAAPIVLVQKKPTVEQPKISSAAALFNQSDSEDEGAETEPLTVEKRKHLAVLDELQTEESKIKRAFIPYETAPIVIEDEPEEIPWIRKGLLIRIKNAQVSNGKYDRMLAVIDAVIEDFGAQVSVLKSGDQLLLDQDDCSPVAEVSDAEYDDQLGSLDAKITANALKSNRCIILADNYIGREGRFLGKRADTGRFQVEVTEAGSSHIHRLKLDLNTDEFCIFFE